MTARFFLLVSFLFSVHGSFAQCDKPVTLVCNKAREIKSGVVGNEIPMEATIVISQGKISVTGFFRGETETLEGVITEVSACDWKEFLKNGRTQYKALFKKGDEMQEKTIMDIVSEDNFTTITLGSDPDKGSKLQFVLSEYTIMEAQTNTPAPSGNTKQKKKKKGQ